jgi:AcrR family transcriptional regulator
MVARRRGPAPRLSREQLVAAAVSVAESEGFGALSLRSVARHLGVGPMTLYTYVDSSDQLAALVVDELVAEAIRGLRWPKSWRGVLRLFAKKFDALVEKHPAMVDAYGRGLVRSELARRVEQDVESRLIADGLTAAQARCAYLGVHALVLGHAVLRSGFAIADAQAAEGSRRTSRPRRDASLQLLVDQLLEGVISTRRA